MIVVTGSTGKLGRGIVEQLLARMPAEGIVASVRDPAKAGNLAEPGVQVRRGDFADRASLRDAFAGAQQVLIVSVDQFGEVARRLHRNAIEAAHAAGAGRVLYTSHMGARPDSAFADHDAAERVLGDTGMPFTSLRHGFYAESAFYLIGRGFETGEIRVPEDGPVSWTDRDDLAQADAAVLAGDGRFDGITPPLTALEAFTMADLAAIGSELLGRELKHVVLPDAQWHAEQVAHGVPAPMADALLGMFRSARRGELAATDPTLCALLGRQPKTMREVLAAVLKL